MKKIIIILYTTLFIFLLSHQTNGHSIHLANRLDQYDYISVENNASVTSPFDSYVDFFNHLSNHVLKSAVMVFSIGNQPSRGSGVVFLEDDTHYYALTNHHVIYKAPNETKYYRVQDYLGNIYDAEVIHLSPSYDLAVVKFLKTTMVFELIPFAKNNANVSEYVSIIGFPNTQVNAITMGEVTNYRVVEISNTPSEIIDITFSVMEMNAPVKGGSSGSLVVNQSYELIGILYAATLVGSQTFFSFAIPIEKVIEFLELGSFEVGGEKA